jgi:hypothetical protein
LWWKERKRRVEQRGGKCIDDREFLVEDEVGCKIVERRKGSRVRWWIE